MRNALQDQLLEAGLADARQAKKPKAEKAPKRRKRKGGGDRPANEMQRGVERARADAAARDRELNRQRQAQAERKARASQIRDLIAKNRLPRDDAELGFNFVDRGKVRKLHVTDPIRRQLSEGRAAIVRMDERYEVVPRETADRIRTRDPRCLVELPDAAPEQEADENDPYAAYKVPDDLMW